MRRGHDAGEVADVPPCLVAQLDRATLIRVLTVVAEGLGAQATAADELGEWEADGPA